MCAFSALQILLHSRVVLAPLNLHSIPATSTTTMSSDLSILSGDFLGADGPGLSRASQVAKRLYKQGRLFR
jgi:hypothetical protein